ncbi:MAG: TraX family protein [Candidatus Fimivivens sp.]
MRGWAGFSGTALQIVAVLSMTCDHIGAAIIREGQIPWAIVQRDMPALFALRAIGRIAFPVFAFLLAQGMAHTHSRKAFILRLGAFSLLSEIPFDLALFGVWFYPDYQNVFFTLFLGAVSIAILDYGERGSGVIAVLGLALVAQALNTDYAALGVLTVVMFWVLAPKGRWGVAVVLLLFVGNFLRYGQQLYWSCLMSLPLLLCYNGVRGGPSGSVGKALRKWGFYFYYPLHLLVLFALVGR